MRLEIATKSMDIVGWAQIARVEYGQRQFRSDRFESLHLN